MTKKASKQVAVMPITEKVKMRRGQGKKVPIGGKEDCLTEKTLKESLFSKKQEIKVSRNKSVYQTWREASFSTERCFQRSLRMVLKLIICLLKLKIPA